MDDVSNDPEEWFEDELEKDEDEDEMDDEIEEELQGLSKKEVSSKEIGELVMKKLKVLDEVAYVRFASVYHKFKDINEFLNELRSLLGS